MEIVHTSVFDKMAAKAGISKADIGKLEDALIAHPLAGDVIQGLGGARKVRFSMAGRGKQGGGRAIYVVVLEETIYLLMAYSKKDQSDLSERQRRIIADLIKELKDG